MSARNMAKRTAAGTLALAVCLGGGALALAGAAQADANFKFDTRVQGDDRYATAIAASKAAFPDAGKTENVILVNGYATVDGLTASYLAGVVNAPILYVSDKGADADTKAEIKRLGVKNVWLIGGEKVIPASVKTAIEGDGYKVQRINGEDRYETAKLIAAKGAELSGHKPSKVFVASGTSFADALAVSPIAYAKGYAIALTEKDSTSQFTKDELGAIGTDNKILVGGEAVVSKKVAADLSIKEDARIAGADRAVTANLVSDWAKKSEGFNAANAALVGGGNGNGADSLVASALGAKSFTTLHFAGWDATYTYLKDHSAELTGKGFVFGGKAAVAGDQVDKAEKAVQTVASNQSIKVDSSDVKTLVIPDTEDKTDDRGYTASGLKDDVEYRVTLVAASSVAVDKAGNVTFKSSADSASKSGFSVDAGTRSSVITVVNGSPVAANIQTVTAKAVGGNLTFTIDGVSSDDVIPVVYVNGGTGKSAAEGGTSIRLETDAKSAGAFGSATEAFGLGGLTIYVPAEAANGTVPSATPITKVYKSANTIVAGGKTFKYDDNDKFSIAGAPVTLAKFVESLSAGDQLDGGKYASDKDLSSSFNLLDLSPAGPVSVAAAADSDNPDTAVKLAWNPEAGVDSQNVYVRQLDSGNAEDSKLDTYKLVKTLSATDDHFTVTGLTASTRYAFSVTSVKDGDESSHDADGSDVRATSASIGPKTAQSTKIAFVSSGATTSDAALLDTGDKLVIQFDRAITAKSGDTIKVIDAGGDEATLTNGKNATFSVGGDNGDVLTVTLTDSVALNTARDNGLIDVAAGGLVNITASTVGNSVGAWNLAGSTQTVFVAGNAGTNAALVGSPAAAKFRANATTNRVTLDASHGLATGDVVRVYNSNGVLLGSGTATALTALNISASDIKPGETLLVNTVVKATGEVTKSTSVTVAPYLLSAAITKGATAGFGNNVGDKLALTFSSDVAAAAAITGTSAVDAGELAALLGTGGTYTGFVGTATLDGSTVVLTTTTVIGSSGSITTATTGIIGGAATITDGNGTASIASLADVVPSTDS